MPTIGNTIQNISNLYKLPISAKINPSATLILFIFSAFSPVYINNIPAIVTHRQFLNTEFQHNIHTQKKSA